MNKLFFNQDHYMIQDMCREFAQNEIAQSQENLTKQVLSQKS